MEKPQMIVETKIRIITLCKNWGAFPLQKFGFRVHYRPQFSILSLPLGLLNILLSLIHYLRHVASEHLFLMLSFEIPKYPFTKITFVWDIESA